MEVMHQVGGNPGQTTEQHFAPAVRAAAELWCEILWSSGWASRVLRAADPALVVTQFSVGEGKGNPMSCLS